MKNMKNSAVDLTDLALGIVVLGIVVSVGAVILVGVRDTSITDTAGCNSTDTSDCAVSYNLANDAALGLAEYGDWFDIIVIVGIAAVILALIFMAFGGRGSSAGVGGSY